MPQILRPRVKGHALHAADLLPTRRFSEVVIIPFSYTNELQYGHFFVFLQSLNCGEFFHIFYVLINKNKTLILRGRPDFTSHDFGPILIQ